MNIEESINKIKEVIYMSDGTKVDYIDINHMDLGGEVSADIFIEAIEILLTAYEKEKEKNEKIDEFCRKELAFERRLQRENRQPDEFNQGRFYVSENVRKIIKEE